MYPHGYTHEVSGYTAPQQKRTKLAGANAGFPPFGVGPPTYDFAKISKNLIKLRTFWAVGVARRGRSPLDPPMARYV